MTTIKLKMPAANIGLNASGADGIFVLLSTFVLKLNISNSKPHLRQAANR